MAKFVLTAELSLQAPKNVQQVVNQIQQRLNNVKVDVHLSGADSAQKQIQSLTNKTNQASNAADKMGKAFVASVRRFSALAIATRAVSLFTSTLGGAVNEAISFERELIKISQVTGTTVSNLGSLTSEITNLATTLGVSSNSLLSVSRILAQTGLSARDTQVALSALAKTDLAPTFDNISQTAEGAVAILNQFGQGAAALESQLGSLNAVAGQFAVESGDLIATIRRTGGVFKSAGGDLNELVALFTSVRATTRESAESIATGLRTIFTRIQRPETIEYLRQFGVELVDLEGKFVGPFEAIRKLSTALAGLGERDLTFVQIAEELGGFRQIGKVLPLLQQFTVAQEALKVAQQGQASLTKDAATAQAALAVQVTKVKEEFFALIRGISDTKTFQIMADSALTLASSLIQLADALKPVLPLLTAFAGIKIARSIGSGIGAILGGRKGFAEGGQVQKFASGGLVGGVGNRDTVPAMLTPGEFVIKKSSVQSIGADKLAAMNAGGEVQKFATGGRVKVNPGAIGGFFLRPEQGDPRSFNIDQTVDIKNREILERLGYIPKGQRPTGSGLQSLFAAKGGKEKAKLLYGSAASNKTYKTLSTVNSQTDLDKLRSSTDPSDKSFIQAFDKNVGNIEANRKKQFEKVASKKVPISGTITGFFPGKDDLQNGQVSQIVKNEAQSVLQSAVKSISNTISSQFPDLGPIDVNQAAIGRSAERLGKSDNAVQTLSGYLFEGMVDALTGAKLAGGSASFDFPSGSISGAKAGLKRLFTSGADGVDSLVKADAKRSASRDSFKNIVNKIAQDLNRGKLEGVTLEKFAAGGAATGTDTVPAMLTPGEFVINKSSAQRIGYGTLNSMNKSGKMANGGKVQHFASGGIVQHFNTGTTGSGVKPTGGGLLGLGALNESLFSLSLALSYLSPAVDENSTSFQKNTANLISVIQGFSSTLLAASASAQLFGSNVKGVDLAKLAMGGGRLPTQVGVGARRLYGRATGNIANAQVFGRAASALTKFLGPIAAVTTAAGLLNSAFNKLASRADELEKSISGGDIEESGRLAGGEFDLDTASLSSKIGAAIGSTLGGLAGLATFTPFGVAAGAIGGGAAGAAAGRAAGDFIGTSLGGNTRDSAVALARSQAAASASSKALASASDGVTQAMKNLEAGTGSLQDVFNASGKSIAALGDLRRETASRISTNRENLANVNRGFNSGLARDFFSAITFGGIESSATRNNRIREENQASRNTLQQQQTQAFSLVKPIIDQIVRATAISGGNVQDVRRQFVAGITASDGASAGQEAARLFDENLRGIAQSLTNVSAEFSRTLSVIDKLNIGFSNVQGASAAAVLAMENLGRSADLSPTATLDNSIATIEASLTSAAANIPQDELGFAIQTASATLEKLGATRQQISDFEQTISGVAAAQRVFADATDAAKERLRRSIESGARDVGAQREAVANEVGLQLDLQGIDKDVREAIVAEIKKANLSDDDLGEIIKGNLSPLRDIISKVAEAFGVTIESLQGFSSATKETAKYQREFVSATQEVIKAQRQLAQISLEAARAMESFGGPKVTPERERQAVIQEANVVGGPAGLTPLRTGSGQELQQRNTELENLMRKLINEQTIARTGRTLDGQQVTPQRQAQAKDTVNTVEFQNQLDAATEAQNAQIGTIRDLIRIKQDEIRITEAKTAAERKAVDALLSGDTNKFFDAIAAQGAAAAAATGNRRLMQQFSATDYGRAAQNVSAMRQAGATSYMGVDIRSLEQSIVSAGMQVAGVNQNIANQMAAIATNTTPQRQQLNQQGQGLAQALRGAGANQETAARIMKQAADKMFNAAQKIAGEQPAAPQPAAGAGGVPAPAEATGGPVGPASSSPRNATFTPRGTDTVPAMLTPGEFVVNARSTAANRSLLEDINNNKKPIYRATGGVVGPMGLKTPPEEDDLNFSVFKDKEESASSQKPLAKDQNKITKEQAATVSNSGKTFDLSKPEDVQAIGGAAYRDLSPFSTSAIGRANLLDAIMSANNTVSFAVDQNGSLERKNFAAEAVNLGGGQTKIIVPSTTVTESLISHEFAHALQVAVGGTGLNIAGDPSIQSFLRNYTEVLNSGGFKADHIAPGEGGIGNYKVEDLLRRQVEIFPTLVQLLSQDRGTFDSIGGSSALSSAMGAYGFSRGGNVGSDGESMTMFKPRGTDTVPAMLTPGEFVVNAKATRENRQLLENINSGKKTQYRARGGIVGPQYLVRGGVADEEEIEVPTIYTVSSLMQTGLSRQEAEQYMKNNFNEEARLEEKKRYYQDRNNLGSEEAAALRKRDRDNNFREYKKERDSNKMRELGVIPDPATGSVDLSDNTLYKAFYETGADAGLKPGSYESEQAFYKFKQQRIEAARADRLEREAQERAKPENVAAREAQAQANEQAARDREEAAEKRRKSELRKNRREYHTKLYGESPETTQAKVDYRRRLEEDQRFKDMQENGPQFTGQFETEYEVRRFESDDGRFSTNARLTGVSEDGQSVTIVKQDGSSGSVPLSRLSSADRDYIDSARRFQDERAIGKQIFNEDIAAASDFSTGVARSLFQAASVGVTEGSKEEVAKEKAREALGNAVSSAIASSVSFADRAVKQAKEGAQAAGEYVNKKAVEFVISTQKQKTEARNQAVAQEFNTFVKRRESGELVRFPISEYSEDEITALRQKYPDLTTTYLPTPTPLSSPSPVAVPPSSFAPELTGGQPLSPALRDSGFFPDSSATRRRMEEEKWLNSLTGPMIGADTRTPEERAAGERMFNPIEIDTIFGRRKETPPEQKARGFEELAQARMQAAGARPIDRSSAYGRFLEFQQVIVDIGSGLVAGGGGKPTSRTPRGSGWHRGLKIKPAPPPARKPTPQRLPQLLNQALEYAKEAGVPSDIVYDRWKGAQILGDIKYFTSEMDSLVTSKVKNFRQVLNKAGAPASPGFEKRAAGFLGDQNARANLSRTREVERLIKDQSLANSAGVPAKSRPSTVVDDALRGSTSTRTSDQIGAGFNEFQAQQAEAQATAEINKPITVSQRVGAKLLQYSPTGNPLEIAAGFTADAISSVGSRMQRNYRSERATVQPQAAAKPQVTESSQAKPKTKDIETLRQRFVRETAEALEQSTTKPSKSTTSPTLNAGDFETADVYSGVQPSVRQKMVAEGRTRKVPAGEFTVRQAAQAQAKPLPAGVPEGTVRQGNRIQFPSEPMPEGLGTGYKLRYGSAQGVDVNELRDNIAANPQVNNLLREIKTFDKVITAYSKSGTIEEAKQIDKLISENFASSLASNKDMERGPLSYKKNETTIGKFGSYRYDTGGGMSPENLKKAAMKLRVDDQKGRFSRELRSIDKQILDQLIKGEGSSYQLGQVLEVLKEEGVTAIEKYMPRNYSSAAGYNTGGMVYASKGKLINFQPRGTDTVPAMLTPGEFVVNRDAAQKNMGLLKQINEGRSLPPPAALASGGMVKYFADGGSVGSSSAAATSQQIQVNVPDIDFSPVTSALGSVITELQNIKQSPGVKEGNSVDVNTQQPQQLNVNGLDDGIVNSLSQAFTTFQEGLSQNINSLNNLNVQVSLAPTDVNVNMNDGGLLAGLQRFVGDELLDKVSAEMKNYSIGETGKLGRQPTTLT